MFRPGLGQESPQPYPVPGPPRAGMQNPSQFGPPFGMQGGPGPAGHQRGPPQQYSGQYPGFSAPPHMPPSPQDAPLPPRDIEMLKNIEILSGFVAKNGPQFEDMARQKQAEDPKFGFLFGGEPGSEAAIGKAYYEWRKRCLIAPKDNVQSPVNEAPASPNGSDMDMEDDFEEPPQIVDKKSEQAQELASKNEAAAAVPPPPPSATNLRPQGAQNPRVPTPLSVSSQGNSATASQTPSQLPSQVALPSRPHSDTAYDELPKRKDTRRRTGFDRPAMEDVTPVPSPPWQQPQQEAGHRSSRGSSRVSRWGPQDQQMKTSEEDPHKKIAERPDSEDRLEAVTPERDVGHEHGKEKDTESPVKSESRKPDARRSPSRAEDSRASKQQQRGVAEPDPGARLSTQVDEFGRFIRPGGSESDAEDSQYDRKRRSGSASRSRSRSPASRRRRRSRSRSPRRHGRWSRSRSRSPRRRRSWSKSPPRDSRRGSDGGRGWDRGHQERGGRRGGRGGGRDPPACLDFARGRCKRGTSCRFLHPENGSSAEGRHERSGRRGNRQDESHHGGGGSSSRSSWGDEPPRSRRGWEDEKEKDYSKEPPKSFEQPDTSPVSDYGDDFGAKPSEKEANDKFHQEPEPAPYSGDPPPLSQLPPPPPPPPHSQAFPPSSVPQPSFNMSFMPSQSGFSHLPPPPPPPPVNHLQMMHQQQPQQQPSYASAAPSYSFPPPPPPSTTYTTPLPQYQLPQQTQFTMMSTRPEPGPPGAGDKGGENATIEHWKGSGGNGASMHMDDVILESVSPGLPGHHHHHIENVSPRLVMENVSPHIPQQQQQQQQAQAPEPPPPQETNPSAGLENVSPAPEQWSPGGEKGEKKRSKREKGEKEDHKVRGLTLLRTAVAEHVKETLKPTWREGQMSKEAFKTIAKKAVDKVLSAIKPHQVPNTEEKVATYMVNARPKIAKLVQGYVDKYVKA